MEQNQLRCFLILNSLSNQITLSMNWGCQVRQCLKSSPASWYPITSSEVESHFSENPTELVSLPLFCVLLFFIMHMLICFCPYSNLCALTVRTSSHSSGLQRLTHRRCPGYAGPGILLLCSFINLTPLPAPRFLCRAVKGKPLCVSPAHPIFEGLML